MYELPTDRVGSIKISQRHLLRADLAAALRSYGKLSKEDQRNAIIVVDKPIVLPDGREKLSLTPRDIAALRAALAPDA
jgi:hypothetical protein